MFKFYTKNIIGFLCIIGLLFWMTIMDINNKSDEGRYDKSTTHSSMKSRTTDSPSPSLPVSSSPSNQEGGDRQKEKLSSDISDGKLFIAFRERDIELIRKLVKICPEIVKSKNKDKSPAIFEAVRTGNKEIVELLLDSGADPNFQDESGYTPLMLSANFGMLEITDLLISRGASLNAINDRAGSPLHMVVIYRQNLNMMKLLISRGANVNILNKYGDPPIRDAVSLEDPKIAFYLIRKGAKIDFVTRDHRNLLHVVENPEIAQYLLNKGLDVNAKDDDGSTPLHTLPCRFWSKSLLDKHDFKQMEIAKIFVSKGADVNARNSRNETPLIIAAKNGYVFLTRYLISRGAMVDVKDSSGKTPLDYASERGNYATTAVLAVGFFTQNTLIRFLLAVLLLAGFVYAFRKYFFKKDRKTEALFRGKS